MRNVDCEMRESNAKVQSPKSAGRAVGNAQWQMAKLGWGAKFSALFTYIRLCSLMFGYVRICSDMFGYVRICSDMFGLRKKCAAEAQKHRGRSRACAKVAIIPLKDALFHRETKMGWPVQTHIDANCRELSVGNSANLQDLQFLQGSG